MKSERIDPATASIDGLIEWLRCQRAGNPQTPLSRLLANRQIPNERLVDLACIDLIQRRRMGHAVGAEQYLNEFPDLASRDACLDLIDAELCVARELGESIEPEAVIKRFPSMAESIRQLLQMGACTAAVPLPLPVDPAGTSPHAAFASNNQQRDEFAFGIAQSPSPLPVSPPSWFTESELVCVRGADRLVRGRDANRGVDLALKLVQLPDGLGEDQIASVLGDCESASRIINPHWVCPLLAAVSDRYLCLIRPWVFANRWRVDRRPGPGRAVSLRQLAAIAFALQAAHDAGVSHGGVHSGNVLIDHDGRVQITDAVGTAEGLKRRIDRAESRSLQSGIDGDIRQLLQFVSTAVADFPSSGFADVAASIRSIAGRKNDQLCGAIGEQLMRLADCETVE